MELKKLTLDDCYDRWVNHLRSRSKPARRRTIEEYERTYRNHIQETLGSDLVQAVTAKKIQGPNGFFRTINGVNLLWNIFWNIFIDFL